MTEGEIWYHGSPLRLTMLRAGSTITQDRDRTVAGVLGEGPPMVPVSVSVEKSTVATSSPESSSVLVVLQYWLSNVTHLDSFDEDRFECLDPHAVQRGGPVKHHRVVVDHLLEDVPHLLVLALQHLLGALDRVGVPQLLQPADDEGLVQLQGDLLGQAALVQVQLRADDDDRPGRVVHPLAEQVLAEPALLADFLVIKPFDEVVLSEVEPTGSEA